MTTEEPFGQAFESVVAVEVWGGRHTIFETHISVLLAAAWTTADDPVELGVHRDVGESLARGGDPAAFELAGEFRSRQGLAASQRLGQQFFAASEQSVLEFEPPIVVRVGSVNSWTGQLQE